MSQKSKTIERTKSSHPHLFTRLKTFCLNHKPLTIIISALVLIVAVFAIWQIAIPHPVRLSDASYGGSEQIDLTADTYNQLIDNRASFIVFIDQPGCITADKLREMLSNIASEYQIHIYHLMWSNVKNTNLRDHVKYYPSVAIIRNGQVVDAIDADSDAHTAYYNSEADLKNWISRYVKLS